MMCTNGTKLSSSDELFASFVSRKRHVPLHMVQEFLDLIHHPQFRLEELNFKNAEDTLSYGPSLRRQLTFTQGSLSAMVSRPLTPPSEKPVASSTLVLPEDIIDLIASHVARTCPSFATVAAAQERAAMTSQGRYVLHKESQGVETLRNMSMVSSYWTIPAHRHMRRVARAVGAPGLRSILASPQALTGIRELHVILPPPLHPEGLQPAEDLREVLFLLNVLLGKVHALEALYLQTSTHAFSDNPYPFVETALTEMFEKLGNLNTLQCLWLTHITGPTTPARVGDAAKHLEKLYVVLPRMQRLRQLWVHNWCEGRLHLPVPHRVGSTHSTDVSSFDPDNVSFVKMLSYRLGAGGITFAELLQLGANSSPIQAARPLSTLFARAALNVTHLRLLASNLFVQHVHSASTLLVALTPPPPLLEHLELTLDNDVEMEIDHRELSIRLLAPSEAPSLRELRLVLSGPRTNAVPPLALPPQLRVLHVHCAKSVLGRTCLRSVNMAIEGELWWTAIDTSLEYMLRMWAAEAKRNQDVQMRNGRGADRLALEEVLVTLDLTTQMLHRAERDGGDVYGRWDIEGVCFVPRVRSLCDTLGINFNCYRTSLQ